MNVECPCVEIIEQPATKALRFRYRCEAKSSGVLPGINSTKKKRTFPTIKITGYEGRAKVIVSCVTEHRPYKPHPYILVGESCEHGICTREFPAGSDVLDFTNLSIQCVKKKDIEEQLKIRKELYVDPFRTGFEYKEQHINFNAVRLCFQVFLEGSQKEKFNIRLPPVVSNPIYNKKISMDLVIHKLSHSSASVVGGIEAILLCDEVTKEDIKVRFFEEKDGRLFWEGYGDFQPTDVYKKLAVAFKTPRYYTQNVSEPVQMYIQLKRPSDGATSEPLPFQMLPINMNNIDKIRSKRQRFNSNISQSVYTPNITKLEKYDRTQPPIFNIAETVSTNQILLLKDEDGKFLTLTPVTEQSHSDMQTPMPQMLPEPQTFPYVSIPEQQHLVQYQPSMNQSLIIDAQPSSGKEINQMQLYQIETNSYIMSSITQDCKNITNITKNQNEILQPLIAGKTDVQSLNMDTHNTAPNWKTLDPTDIADLDLVSLSANLSSEMCITDSGEAAPII